MWMRYSNYKYISTIFYLKALFVGSFYLSHNCIIGWISWLAITQFYILVVTLLYLQTILATLGGIGRKVLDGGGSWFFVFFKGQLELET